MYRVAQNESVRNDAVKKVWLSGQGLLIYLADVINYQYFFYQLIPSVHAQMIQTGRV